MFAQGLKEARSAIQQFKTAAQAYIGFEAIKGAGQAVAGFVANSMSAIDSTRLMAERLGVSTQALSELQYAAKLSGVDSETLDHSLEKLNERLATAATEGGPAADALRMLGLSAVAGYGRAGRGVQSDRRVDGTHSGPSSARAIGGRPIRQEWSGDDQSGGSRRNQPGCDA